jgi:hypothetical protein
MKAHDLKSTSGDSYQDDATILVRKAKILVWLLAYALIPISAIAGEPGANFEHFSRGCPSLETAWRSEGD